MAEQTELEKILTKIFQEEKIKMCDRAYQFNFDIKTEKDGKTVSESVPWFCAGDDKLYSFIEDWSFFWYGDNKRLRVEYVNNLLLYALVQHCDETSGAEPCIVNPTRCRHTMRYLYDFFSRSSHDKEDESKDLLDPSPEQMKIIDSLIQHGLFLEEIHLIDKSVKDGSGMIFRVFSKPDLKLNAQGYFEKKQIKTAEGKMKEKRIIYHSEKYDALDNFAYRGTHLLAQFDEKCKGIMRGKLSERPDLIGLIQEVVAQEYLP